MLESNLKPVGDDVKTLITDAQTLFQSAATLSGEKADDVHRRGLLLLDAAASKAKDARANALAAGKQMVTSANAYVKESPWIAISAAAGLGVLAALIARRN